MAAWWLSNSLRFCPNKNIVLPTPARNDSSSDDDNLPVICFTIYVQTDIFWGGLIYRRQFYSLLLTLCQRKDQTNSRIWDKLKKKYEHNMKECDDDHTNDIGQRRKQNRTSTAFSDHLVRFQNQQTRLKRWYACFRSIRKGPKVSIVAALTKWKRD